MGILEKPIKDLSPLDLVMLEGIAVQQNPLSRRIAIQRVESRAMHEAMKRQFKQREKSHSVDRAGWTRQQWIDDARALMYHIDGAITSLVNGHVMALLEEVDIKRKPINIVFDGPPGPVSGRFIEVEDDDENGLNVGEWIKHSQEGWQSLRITELPVE